jgi:hypothetical protein
MATFWETCEVDLTPKQIYEKLSIREEIEMIAIFEDRGKAIGLGSKTDQTFMDEQWREIMFKLAKGRHQLTVEEEEAVKKIANRL